MSDLREQRPPIHSPIGEPVASDGSSLTVIRDAQGQISEASGTGRDGVVRRLTVTSKITTNPAGFHFIGMQLDFYENGEEYLRLGTIFSPDAGKASFQAYSRTSQFGFAIGISSARGQATLFTSTGPQVTVDLSRVSPLSAHNQGPLSPVRGTLTLPQGIQEALSKAGYFQPLFELEKKQNTANLDAALQAVNLSTAMHADVLVSRLDSITSPGMSKPEKSLWKALAWGIAWGVGLALGAMIFTPGIGAAVATLYIIDGVLVTGAASLAGDYVDSLPGPPSAPTGTNDTPPNDVVVPPLPPSSPDGGPPPDDVPQPPPDGGPPSDDVPQTPDDIPQPPPANDANPADDNPANDIVIWPSGQAAVEGGLSGDATVGVEGPISGISEGDSGGGGGSRPGGGDAGSGSSGGASGSPSDGSGSGTAGQGGTGESGGGESGGGESGGGESGGGESGGGESGGGGGGGTESVSGHKLQTHEGGDPSQTPPPPSPPPPPSQPPL